LAIRLCTPFAWNGYAPVTHPTNGHCLEHAIESKAVLVAKCN